MTTKTIMKKKTSLMLIAFSTLLLLAISAYNNRSYAIIDENVEALCRLYPHIEGNKYWTPHYLDDEDTTGDSKQEGVVEHFNEQILVNNQTGDHYWICVHPYAKIIPTELDVFCFLFNFRC